MATAHNLSERRLAANRANAGKSTGPRTPEGKAKSSLNAVKTGLTGRTMVMTDEDVDRYVQHVEGFYVELKPVGPLETALVQSLADTQWRLSRIPGLETGILALGRKRCAPDLFAEETNAPVRELLLEAHILQTEAQALKNLHLQESRLRRRYAQDRKELERLQTERDAEQKQNNAGSPSKRETLFIRKRGTGKHPQPRNNGFEFSTLPPSDSTARSSRHEAEIP